MYFEKFKFNLKISPTTSLWLILKKIHSNPTLKLWKFDIQCIFLMEIIITIIVKYNKN